MSHAKRRSPVGRLALAAAGAAVLMVATPTSPSAEPRKALDALRLRVLKIHDPAVGGDEAFRMLVPDGWKTEGGVVWQHNRSNLATVAMRVFDPRGTEALEFFPIVPFTWTEGGIAFFPVGSVYLGNEVLPPIYDAAEFVERILVPRHRSKVTGLRITGKVELPEVAKEVARAVQEPGVVKTVEAAKVRLAYTEGGKELEEDIYCVLVYSTSPMLPGTTFWGPERLAGFRAAKGELDRFGALLQAMFSSFRISPVWFSKYRQVVQMWQQNQMQAIRNAGELSRYIARTSDEISDLVRQQYENQQKANDRVNERFARYIRGVESYRNPFDGRDVDLPSGYGEAWVSGRGEYVLSNDPNFDPNVGDTVEWRRMQPRR